MRRSSLNVLAIIVHDLGRRLGCYGAPDVRSPHLDALAESSMRLANHFCGAPQCLPSRAGLWTGHEPHDTGLVCFPDTCELRPDVPHVAALLAEQGWQTNIFGMQHVVHERVEGSCDPGRRSRLGFMFDHGQEHTAAAEADKVIAWLQQRRQTDPPFFAHLGISEPHRPFPRQDVELQPLDQVQVPDYLPDLPATRQELAEMEASICTMDRAVGRVLKALDSSPLADQTIVIFTTDHGIPFPRAKASLYDPGIEAALICRIPDQPAGGVVQGLTSHVDLVPTILDVLGMQIPDHMQGQSFRQLLTDSTCLGRSEIYAGKTRHAWWDPMRCIRTDRWKLIVNFDYQWGPEWPLDYWQGPLFHDVVSRNQLRPMHAAKPMTELYDLESDPAEQVNLAQEPGHASTRDALTRKLRNWMQRTHDPLLDPTFHSQHFTQRMQSFRNC